MEYPITASAVVMPLPAATVFIDADRPWHVLSHGVVRNDQSKMTCFCDHRISSIAPALAIKPRMHMDIGNDGDAVRAAVIPNLAELCAVEFHDTVGEADRVHVVIEQELAHMPHVA